MQIHTLTKAIAQNPSKLAIFLYPEIWSVKCTQKKFHAKSLVVKKLLKIKKYLFLRGGASKKNCWHQHWGVMWPWNFAQTCLSKSYAHWQNFKFKCFVVQKLLKKLSQGWYPPKKNLRRVKSITSTCPAWVQVNFARKETSSKFLSYISLYACYGFTVTRFLYKNVEISGSLGYVRNFLDFKPKNVLKVFLLFDFNRQVFWTLTKV